MICEVKDLTVDERQAIEKLLGHALSEGQQLNIRTFPAPVPVWLQPAELGRVSAEADAMTMEEIDAEIALVRQERRASTQRLGQ